MSHGEKRRRKQDLKFKFLLCLQFWNTATCCSSLEEFGSQSSRELVSHSVLTQPSLCLVYISKKLPYEPGHAQDFFLSINSDTKKVGFSHNRCRVKKRKKEKKDTDLPVIEGLCIIMDICGTFLSKLLSCVHYLVNYSLF